MKPGKGWVCACKEQVATGMAICLGDTIDEGEIE